MQLKRLLGNPQDAARELWCQACEKGPHLPLIHRLWHHSLDGPPRKPVEAAARAGADGGERIPVPRRRAEATHKTAQFLPLPLFPLPLFPTIVFPATVFPATVFSRYGFVPQSLLPATTISRYRFFPLPLFPATTFSRYRFSRNRFFPLPISPATVSSRIRFFPLPLFPATVLHYR